MVSLLFQLLIGGIILSSVIFYAALFIAARHEDSAANAEAQMQSIRTVPPSATEKTDALLNSTPINSASVRSTSVGST